MSEISRADIYREQSAHFRFMNDIPHKIPPLLTAVLGGLWYFAANNLVLLNHKIEGDSRREQIW